MIVQDEANSGRPGGRESIVPNKPDVPTAGISHCSSILSFHHASPMVIVRNKANLSGVIWRISAVRIRGCDELNPPPGRVKQSQSKRIFKFAVLGVKPENPKVWTSDFTLYTSNLAYVFGTWHVASWFLAQKRGWLRAGTPGSWGTVGRLWRGVPAVRLGIRLGRGIALRPHPGRPVLCFSWAISVLLSGDPAGPRVGRG